MPDYIVILLSICVLASAAFTAYSFKKTLVNLYFKTFTSVAFTVLGLFSLYALVAKGIQITDNRLIGGFFILLGLMICMVGDVILGLPKLAETTKSFAVIVGGAAWFFIGHVLYCATLIVLFGISPIVILFVVPLSLIYTFLNRKLGNLDYKNLTVGVLIYSVVESLSLAICATELIEGFSVAALILTIGFALFFFSDMVLMHNYFGEKRRRVSVLCHGSYYPAQILIALSIMFLA